MEFWVKRYSRSLTFYHKPPEFFGWCLLNNFHFLLSYLFFSKCRKEFYKSHLVGDGITVKNHFLLLIYVEKKSLIENFNDITISSRFGLRLLGALRHTHFFISTEGWYLKWYNSTCLMVDEKLEVAIPVGFVHNKDFIRKVLVGKVGAAFCVTIRRELDRPNIACGMLGWIEIWEVSLGCCCCWFSLAFEDSIFDFCSSKRNDLKLSATWVFSGISL